MSPAELTATILHLVRIGHDATFPDRTGRPSLATEGELLWKRLGYPNNRAFVERFIGTIRRECWDHFIFFGKLHLEHVTKIWLEYYHRKRPHQGRENELRVKPKTTAKRKKNALLVSKRKRSQCVDHIKPHRVLIRRLLVSKRKQNDYEFRDQQNEFQSAACS